MSRGSPTHAAAPVLSKTQRLNPPTSRAASVRGRGQIPRPSGSLIASSTQDVDPGLIPAPGSFFQSAHNIEIQGGQFNATQGHHTNLTINLHQTALDDVDELPPTSNLPASTHSIQPSENDAVLFQSRDLVSRKPFVSLKLKTANPLAAVAAAPNDILSWMNRGSREIVLFNSWGVLYRFHSTVAQNGQTFTTMWRTPRPNREDRVAKLDWSANGGLGRVVMGMNVFRMADLVRPDETIYGARYFTGPDGLQYRWPSTATVDIVLQDPNGEIIAFFHPTQQVRYELGDVYGELHYIRHAGLGTVMHPPMMDMVTLTAILYRFCTIWDP